MTFPTINFKFNDLSEAKALQDLVEQKCATLEKYLQSKAAGICDVEFSKVSPQQNGQIHRVEINFTTDGALYRAEATEESFEKAIDAARNELDRELRAAKEKQATLKIQGGREVKEKLLGV